jgi:hypothetical protein
MTNSYFNTDVDALRRHLDKIRDFATESLEAAAQRRDAVLAELRVEEQRLAALIAERRATEKALAEMHEQIGRLSRDLELLGANLGMLPLAVQPGLQQPTNEPAPGPRLADTPRLDLSATVLERLAS